MNRAAGNTPRLLIGTPETGRGKAENITGKNKNPRSSFWQDKEICIKGRAKIKGATV